MKKLIIFPFIFFSLILNSQSKDSILVYVIDSLIKDSKKLLDNDQPINSILLIDSVDALLKNSKLNSIELNTKILDIRARAFFATSKFDEAQKLYLFVKDNYESIIGKKDESYAWCLFNLGLIYHNKLNLDEAENYFVNSKEIFKNINGKESHGYSSCLEGLGNLYSARGNFESAKDCIIQCLDIRKQLFSYENKLVSNSLNNLGVLYLNYGFYELARKTLEECIELRKKILGEQHSEYLRTLNNLAVLYNNIGLHELAEEKYLKCAKLKLQKFGELNTSYALTLNNIGAFYFGIGNYIKAEEYLSKAFRIRSAILSNTHPDYLLSLTNLGSIYVLLSKYSEAEYLLLKAAHISDSIFPITNKINLNALVSLAVLNKKLGKVDAAEIIYIDTKKKLDLMKDKYASDYSYLISNMAEFYLEMNKIKKAKELCIEASILLENLKGFENQNFIDNLRNLCIIDLLENKCVESNSIILKLNRIKKDLIQTSMKYLSINELDKYLKSFEDIQSLEYSIFNLNCAIGDSLFYDYFNNALFYKSMYLKLDKKLVALDRSKIFANVEAFNYLKSYQRNLAYEFTLPKNEREQVDYYQTKIDSLERILIKANIDNLEQPNISWGDVKRNLKQSEVALEIVHYKYYNPFATDSIMYAAILIRANDKSPQFIPLFEQNQFSKLLIGLSKEPQDVPNAIYSPMESTSLSKLIYTPLENYLKDVKTIYISVSGVLNRINLSAIPIDKNILLGNKYDIYEMESTRNVLERSHENKFYTANNSIALFGDIKYELDTSESFISNELTLHTTDYSDISFKYADRGLSLRGNNWSNLDGTKMEIDKLDGACKRLGWKSTVYRGNGASEEEIKIIGNSHNSPRVLHIATHGYFYPDLKDTTLVSKNVFLELGKDPVYKLSEHPMIRSGLILAGGNYAWKNGQAFKPNMEDGILTAFEVSQLDFSNTELVVLSACETGLGDIQGNEGVYGLQRAFKIAGAKYLIMSLWQVPDDETVNFMTTFYRYWLQKGLIIPEAFRKTQNKMKKKFKDPYKWAGFVLIQ